MNTTRLSEGFKTSRTLMTCLADNHHISFRQALPFMIHVLLRLSA